MKQLKNMEMEGGFGCKLGYPFGMQVPGRVRSYPSSGYRYGFGGHEKDDEVHGGWYAFGDYGYDSRLGRRPTPDPVDQISISNYAVFANNPIYYIDPNGQSAEDFIVEGKNNSSLTVKTDVVDVTISTDIDFGGNHTIADLTNIAVGYTYGVEGTATIAGGVQGSYYGMSTCFFGGDYADYWYDYKGTETQTQVTSSGQLTGGVAKGWFIAFNQDPKKNNPQDFAGTYSGGSVSGGAGLLLAGVSANGQWATSTDGSWNILSLGISVSIGPQVSMFGAGSASVGINVSGKTTLLNPTNYKRTSERSWYDKGLNWVTHLLSF